MYFYIVGDIFIVDIESEEDLNVMMEGRQSVSLYVGNLARPTDKELADRLRYLLL